MRARSCSLFFYEGYVGVAPTIVNLASVLNAADIGVTIYATKTDYADPGSLGDQTTVHYFSRSVDTRFSGYINKTLRVFRLSSLIPIIDLVLFFIQSFYHILLRLSTEASRNNINIGVDRSGTIVAWIKSLIFQQKLVYLSLELNSPYHLTGGFKVLSFLERLAFQKAKCIIVQDEERASTLCEYNRYKHPKIFLLPNSPIANYESDNYEREYNYFRELFDLSFVQFPFLVAQVGMIEDVCFSKELASAFSSIEYKYALIYHDRIQRESTDPYINELKKKNKKNLFLSLDPVPFDQIHKIYKSISIGIAFYRDIDNNFSQISKASGKLSYYLMHGKPVIVNNLDSFAKLLEKYNFGAVVKDPGDHAELMSCLEKISNNYEYYSNNARVCFREEFDFSKKAAPLVSFITGLLDITESKPHALPQPR